MIIDASKSGPVSAQADWFAPCADVPSDILWPLVVRDPAQRHPAGGDPHISIEDESEDAGTEREKAIVCRLCGHVITKPDERIEVQGAHQHTFANPQGMVFEIGCFRFAHGCALVGPLTEEFTWFKGFSWRVAVCGACMSHLGWLYLSPGGDSFCGLILDRLVQPT